MASCSSSSSSFVPSPLVDASKDSFHLMALRRDFGKLKNVIDQLTIDCIQRLLEESNAAYSNCTTQPELLQKRIWSPIKLREACLKLKQPKMIAWLSANNKEMLGYLPPKYFERIKDEFDPTKYRAMEFRIKNDVKPSDALEAAFNGLTICDGTVACQLVRYKALLTLFGEAKFNRLFDKAVGQQMKISWSHTDREQPMNLFLNSSNDYILSEWVAKLFETFGGASLPLEIGSVREFKIDLLCDLIRVPLNKINLLFVETLRSSPKTQISNALLWGEELMIREGEALPISEFDSCLDDFIRRSIGEELFSSNIAKVIINGTRFVLIADRHQNQAFRGLLMPLIEEINRYQNGKIALFLESQPRNELIEQQVFSHFLQGMPIQGLFFGMEHEIVGMITHWLYIANLLQKKSPSTVYNTYQWDLCYDLSVKPYYRSLWKKLKKQVLEPSVRSLIDQIDQLVGILRTEMPKQSVDSFLSKFSNACWIELLKKLIEECLKVSPFNDSEIHLTKQALTTLGQDAFSNNFYTLNFETRDYYITQNIVNVLPSLPKDCEVVLFVGYAHMQGITRRITSF